MAASSPSSSPRLPSPPPIAEDQIGPTSPGLSLFEDHGKFPGVNSIDLGASRRIRPGTRAEDMAEGPPFLELQDIPGESAFPLTEYLKGLYYFHTHPPGSNTIQPISADIAKQLSTPPLNTSREIWLYELGRLLIQKTNAIIVALFADNPPCSPQTCPEMRASEWQYLCAVHDPPKSCAAIDYCCHTLDWAATTLTSSKMFPSRLGLGSNSGATMSTDKVLQQQMKEIKNIFRRVYRIFAHAWFQHREMFWRVESKTGLYVFFKMVCDEYGIIETENYTIPVEAEGLEPSEEQSSLEDVLQAPSLLRRDQDAGLGMLGGNAEAAGQGEMVSMGDTTKRHMRTLSDYSNSVNAVIQEEAEPEEEEQEPEKPSLPRQTTALKDRVEQPTEEPVEEDQVPDDEPVPGMIRSDTLKPTSMAEDVDEGEEDVAEAEAREKNVEVIRDKKAETEEAIPQTQDEPAAEGDDAGKTVGD